MIWFYIKLLSVLVQSIIHLWGKNQCKSCVIYMALFFFSQKWVEKSKCNIHCVMSSTSDCISLGDALREIDREVRTMCCYIVVDFPILFKLYTWYTVVLYVLKIKYLIFTCYIYAYFTYMLTFVSWWYYLLLM